MKGRIQVVGLLFAGPLAAQGLKSSFPLPAAKHTVRLEKSVMVPMRDGIKLSTDFYFPEGAGDKLPTILIRTPYNKLPGRQPGSLSIPAYHFAGQGFAVAVQDVRGKFESEGTYVYAGNDARDGYDATEWLAAQSWSNGKIGTYGCSYLGEVQYQQATQRAPHLTAMIPQAAGPMQYRGGGGIEGGAYDITAFIGWFRANGSKVYYRPPEGLPRARFLEAAQYFDPAPKVPDVDYPAIWSSLPVIDMMKKAGGPPTDYEDVVSRDFTDPWWDKTDVIKTTDRFDVPALHVNSWYDYGVGETLQLVNLLSTNAESPRGRDNQFAIISPTPHCRSEFVTEHTMVGQRDMGDPRLDYYAIYLRWFDYWLKSVENGVTKMPKLQLYVMGRNKWRGENEWPPARNRPTKYYLHSDGKANSRFGTGALSTVLPKTEPPDRYTYDPATPVPTSGGTVCVPCARSAAATDGAVNQADVETRHDILVYSTPELAEGLETTGHIEVRLYVSSSALDTDFTAKLVDVFPDGTAYNVQEGILRARYREGFDQKVRMRAGEVYPITIDLHATSLYFGPGHRIRLDISSSNFPRFDRNLNTGGKNYDETKWVVAENVVHHSAAQASYILLPVTP